MVILSTCSCAGEFGSGSLEFLLANNWLKVAISRAQTLMIVVEKDVLRPRQRSTSNK